MGRTKDTTYAFVALSNTSHLPSTFSREAEYLFFTITLFCPLGLFTFRRHQQRKCC